MSNQSKDRVQCPKCMGNRYLPIRSGSTSVRSCDRCGSDGWVEDTTPEPLSATSRAATHELYCPVCAYSRIDNGEVPRGMAPICSVCSKNGQDVWLASRRVKNPTPEPLSSNGLDQNEGGFPPTVQTPQHYQSSSGTTPWDLQRGMKSSGNAFVDGRRCDAIKYAFRVKQNMADDLRKAAHCLMEAVAVLEAGGDKSAAVDRLLAEIFDDQGKPRSTST